MKEGGRGKRDRWGMRALSSEQVKPATRKPSGYNLFLVKGTLGQSAVSAMAYGMR